MNGTSSTTTPMTDNDELAAILEQLKAATLASHIKITLMGSKMLTPTANTLALAKKYNYSLCFLLVGTATTNVQIDIQTSFDEGSGFASLLVNSNDPHGWKVKCVPGVQQITVETLNLGSANVYVGYIGWEGPITSPPEIEMVT